MDDEDRTVAFRKRMEGMLADAIAAGECGENSRMAGPWLLVSETYAEDGNRLITTHTNEDNRLNEALGLAEFARIVYGDAVRNWYAEGMDD